MTTRVLEIKQGVNYSQRLVQPALVNLHNPNCDYAVIPISVSGLLVEQTTVYIESVCYYVHVAGRVLLRHSYDTSGHNLLRPLSELPRGRPEDQHGQPGDRSNMASTRDLHERANGYRRNRTVALRAEFLHLPGHRARLSSRTW